MQGKFAKSQFGQLTGSMIVIITSLLLLSGCNSGSNQPDAPGTTNPPAIHNNPLPPYHSPGGDGLQISPRSINSNPFGPPNGYSYLPNCPHACLMPPPPGMTWEQQVAQFEKDNNCKAASTNEQVCTEKWRVDEGFLAVNEGKLKTVGYVPIYPKDIKDKKGNIIHKKGDVIGVSGVTISTGVDLGQQKATSTKAVLDAYIKDKGNPDKVDVAALMKKLDHYFGRKKQKAVDALVNTPLTVTEAEAQLLADAFGYDTQKRVAKRFDAKNTQGMVFKKLPEEAQTVIVDFAYQYGLSDTKGSIRLTFWNYVYNGEWQKLANWLKRRPDQYGNRRDREGARLQQGIANKHLPETGNPCQSH